MLSRALEDRGICFGARGSADQVLVSVEFRYLLTGRPSSYVVLRLGRNHAGVLFGVRLTACERIQEKSIP